MGFGKKGEKCTPRQESAPPAGITLAFAPEDDYNNQQKEQNWVSLQVHIMTTTSQKIRTNLDLYL